MVKAALLNLIRFAGFFFRLSPVNDDKLLFALVSR